MKLYYCHLAVIPIRKEPSDPSEIVSQLLFGELLEVLEEKNQWRKVRCVYDDYEGWTDHKLFIPFEGGESNLNLRLYDKTLDIKTKSGVQTILKGSNLHQIDQDTIVIGKDRYPIITNHTLAWKENLETIALSYLNTPYLWGGRGFFGIDCSGFSQIVFLFKGIRLPRDAYQQGEIGKLVEVEDVKPMDLAYFTNSKGKVIHVGICLDNHKIIHAHGKVRIDLLDEKGIWNEETKEYSHTFSHIRRIS